MAFSSAQKLHLVVPSKTPWTLAEVAGRLVEISGSTATAALTLTFVLVREAQECGEPVAWVTSTESCFYPLDATQNGMDLKSLVVIRLTNTESIARAGHRYSDAVADALDRPGLSSSHGAGLSHRKRPRGIFSRFFGFASSAR